MVPRWLTSALKGSARTAAAPSAAAHPAPTTSSSGHTTPAAKTGSSAGSAADPALSYHAPKAEPRYRAGYGDPCGDPPLTTQVAINWLNSPDGENWSRNMVGQQLVHHGGGDGAFASVLPDPDDWNTAAHWTPSDGWTDD